jgi:hypothetical protein
MVDPMMLSWVESKGASVVARQEGKAREETVVSSLRNQRSRSRVKPNRLNYSVRVP